MKTLTAALAGAVLLAGVAHADDTVKIKPGEWETSTNLSITMDMGGTKSSMPAQMNSSKECVTEEDASFSPEDLADASCSVSNIVTTANSLSFDISCDQGGMPMSGSLSYTLADDRESGTGTIAMSGGVPGQVQVDVSGTVSSKRIGDCE